MKRLGMRRLWTLDEDDRLRKLRGQGLIFSEIANFFPDRSFDSVKKRWEYINMPDEMAARRAERKNARQREKRERERGIKEPNAPYIKRVTYMNIPDRIIADRNARNAAERSLTAILMGDPEPNRVRW